MVNRQIETATAVLVGLVGLALAWGGGLALLADAITADLQGTRGGLAPLPMVTSAVGIVAFIWGVSVLVWRLATAVHAKTPRRPSDARRAPTHPDPR